MFERSSKKLMTKRIDRSKNTETGKDSKNAENGNEIRDSERITKKKYKGWRF
jgi:hypothetical protein